MTRCPLCGGAFAVAGLRFDYWTRMVVTARGHARLTPGEAEVTKALIECGPMPATHLASTVYRWRAIEVERPVEVIKVLVMRIRRKIRPLGADIVNHAARGTPAIYALEHA